MMKLSEMIKKLEEAGVDTSKFNLELNGVVLTPSELVVAKKYVSQTDIESELNVDRNLFKVVLGTLGVTVGVGEGSLQKTTDKEQSVLDMNNYLSTQVNYSFALNDLADVLLMLKKHDELAEKFYSVEVVDKTVDHFLKKLYQYNKKYKLRSEPNVGEMKNEYNKCATFTEASKLLRKWAKRYAYLPNNVAKCSDWKDSYKGYSSYKSLVYLFTKEKHESFPFHNKEDNLDWLESFEEMYKNTPWKYYLLLQYVMDNQ